MKLLLTILAFLSLFTPVASSAEQSMDLSRYPCNVFSSTMCFRLPNGTSVEYSVPSDFDFYVVKVGASVLATIYIGNAPQVPDSLPTRQVSLRSAVVSRYEDGPKNITHVLITPKDDSAPVFHLMLDSAPTATAHLPELLSSIRSCRAIRRGGLSCPTSQTWSNAELQITVPGSLPQPRMK